MFRSRSRSSSDLRYADFCTGIGMRLKVHSRSSRVLSPDLGRHCAIVLSPAFYPQLFLPTITNPTTTEDSKIVATWNSPSKRVLHNGTPRDGPGDFFSLLLESFRSPFAFPLCRFVLPKRQVLLDCYVSTMAFCP